MKTIILRILCKLNPYFDSFTKFGIYWNKCRGSVALHRCRKYMNDARPWNFQGNLQNRRTVATEHTYIDMITGERSELEIFEMRMQKYPLITLKMLFSDMYILKIPEGVGPPDPPSRSAPA